MKLNLIQGGLSEQEAYVHQMVIEFMPTVKIIARKFLKKTPANVELDDLVSCGLLGLMDAAKKFDPKKEVKFKTYAEHRIRGAILDELRAMDWVPRSVRKKDKLLNQTKRKLELIHGGGANQKEICQEMNIAQEEFHQMMRETCPLQIVSVEELEEYNMPLPAQRSIGQNPSDIYKLRNKKTRIYDAIEDLPEREATIMRLYYFESKNLKEISEVLGITESRVSQLHIKAKKNLRFRLEGVLGGQYDLAI